MELFGCGTALLTPFKADLSIDEAALQAHVDWQIVEGVELLVPCGTTGEASTLTEDEYLRVIDLTCRTAAGRVPVFAGCTHNSTAAATARLRHLEKIPGLTGVLTANPYYNRPSQEGQYLHFRTIADSTELPVLLYNIPGRTGANLLPDTVVRLAEIPNIVGIKESSGNMVQITEVLTRTPKHFRVFAGDDALALPTLALGGAGLISVASNVLPAHMTELVRSAIRGDFGSARRLNRRLFPLLQAHFAEPSPGPVKAVLALLGRGEDHLRPPMLPVTPGLRDQLASLLHTVLAETQPVRAGA